jgi:uncharacterized protein YjbJ (UPF0337 family)
VAHDLNPEERAHLAPHYPIKEADMAAADKVNNSADRAKGKLKEVVGKARGDDDLRDEGKDDQSVAKLKQAGEKVKDALRK